MESNSESPIIIQMLKNVKQIIDISKERGCWKDEELKDVRTTYHNVSEILRQLQAKQPQEKDQRFEEIKEDPVKEVDESVEVQTEMEEID
jgi:archaellum component FlaC